MTAFSLPSFDDPFKALPIEAAPETTFRPPRKVRQVATDSAIQANRAQTPQDVQDQRGVKRMSIGELNAADMPTLMERYQAHRYDDRGAITRFLDLLDLPRNAILSTVFPSIRRRKEAEGDTGTFGLGSVHFSDVLDELGVENRVIKGVVGFIGDVALDPLTYVGPGAVGKIVGKGGRVVETTVEGNRAFNAAFRAAARGKAVADDTAAAWLRASGYTDEALAAKRASGMSAKQIEKELRAATYGQRSVANKVGGALGFDLQTSGSALADAFHSPIQSAQSDAAKAFIAKYGRGSAKGYQVGRNSAGKIGLEAVGGDTGKAAGSYLAHIPFTSYGLFVPPFTGEATRAAAMLQQARSAYSSAKGPIGEDVQFFGQPLSKLQELRNEVPQNRSRFSAIADKEIPEAEAIHQSSVDLHAAAYEDTKAARDAAKQAREDYEAARDAHDEALAAASGQSGNVAIGQQVQWTSQGVGQFAEPRTVEAFHLAPDNTLYAKLSGSDTMVPHKELHSWSPPAGSASQETGPWFNVDDHSADLDARIREKTANGMPLPQAVDAVQAELSSAADSMLSVDGAILEDREGLRYRVEHGRSRSEGPKDRRSLRLINPDGTEQWIDPEQAKILARSMRRVPQVGISSVAVPESLKFKKFAAHDAFKKARDEYRQAKQASDMARAARDASALRRDKRVATLKAERDAIAERMRSIAGNDGVRADTLQQAKNIVTATDPHVALGSVVEGLDASRAQNKLNSIGDVLWQHDQLQKRLADARALMLDHATTLEQVEDRKRILAALGPEVDAEVAEGVDKARKDWEATRGGLFDPMPELDQDALALVLAEQGPEAAAELRSQHAKELAAWERNNKFNASEVASDIRQRVMERRTAGFDDATKALINMPQDKADDMETIAKLIHDEFAVRMAQADAMGGTLMEAAKTTDNTALAYIAADLIGLKDTVGGHSMFTSVRNIAKSLFGDTHTAAQTFFNKYDAMTELARSTFALNGGEANRLVRIMESRAKQVREAAVQEKADAIRKGVMGALERNGIDPGRFAEAERVLFPMMILKIDPSGQHWSMFNSEIEQAIKDAKAAGLGPAFDDLMKIGEEHIDALRMMTDDEELAGVLRNQREAYLPGGMTREGAETARSRTPSVGETPTGINSEMGFNKPLTTTRATWQSVRDGETKQVYRYKHDFYSSFIDESGRLTKSGAERLQQAAADARARGSMAGSAGFNAEFWNKWNLNPMSVTADEVSRLSEYEQGIVRAADYNALPIEERMTTAKFKFVDPITKNRDLTSEFAMLKPGVNLPRGMFEESLAESLANRAGAHEFGMIRKQFTDILGGYAQAIPKAAIDDPSRLKIGDEIPFANGSRGRIIKAGGDFVIEVGGEKFRRLRDLPNVRESLEKMGSGVYDSKAIDLVYPEKVAEAFERFAQVEKDPGTVLRIYDQALRYWKGTTLAHASWVVGDMIGGVFQMLMMGIPPTKIIARLRDGFRMALAHDKEGMLKTLGVSASGMNAEELASIARNGGILAGHAHGEPFVKLMDAGVYLPSYSQDLTQAETWKDPIGAIKTRFSEMRGRAQKLHDVDMTNAVFSKIPGASKISKAWRLGVDEGFINHFAAPWFALNGRANDGLRMTAMLALMDDGHDVGGAMMKVLNGMFDMENLSHVERKYFKRMIPFYSWMKHSGLHWTKRMLQNPALLSMAPRVKDAIEESIYGDDRVPQYLRPNWMRDQMALQIGFNPDSRYALTLGTLLPTEQATAVGSALASPFIGVAGLKQLAENVGFGLTLPLKGLIETATGREMFSNREIGFNPSEGDLSYGEYLASQVRPLRELGIGNIRQGPVQKAAEAGVVPLASRLALGGRSQPFDDERIRQNLLREFKQAEQSIRKRVTIAQREGNEGASVEARARLLRLYSEMAQKGLGDQVPAWAREQLGGVAGKM